MITNPLLIDYCASKGAIHAFTKALALNLAKRKIRVNAVAPGPAWTPNIPVTMPLDEVKNFGHGVWKFPCTLYLFTIKPGEFETI